MPTTIPQGRDGPASTGSGLCFHPSIKEIYPCKYLAFPWDYKRGARVHTQRPRTRTRHSFIEQQPALCPHQAETWDLALSRNQLVPLLQAPLGARLYRIHHYTGRRAVLARTSINPLCLTCITIQAWSVTQNYTC
jgi:hypothetical protein